MNFLAHAVLSFNDPDMLAGNMISDFVKGKRQYDFPVPIQKGIRLHRDIDTFTDTHPVTGKMKYFFWPAYRLYSGAFTDIVYDHFLANDKAEFETVSALKHFTEQTYGYLEMNLTILPLKFQQSFPFMKEHDWLLNYRFAEGIEKSFQGLVGRASYLSESDTAFGIFNTAYKALEECYYEFFPLLRIYAQSRYHELSNA